MIGRLGGGGWGWEAGRDVLVEKETNNLIFDTQSIMRIMPRERERES